MLARDLRLEVLTPRGAGGVAVVALRGADRHARASRILRSASRGGDAAMKIDARPRLARLQVGGGEVVDEVLVVDRTELEQIEIHLHGSEAVLGELGVFGGVDRPDDPAMFLLQHALGDAQLALALEQLARPWGSFVETLDSLDDADARAAAIATARERSRIAMALAVPARVVLCGEQNAGKSTLMNRLLFRERVLTGNLPGLTRDPVRECTILDGYPYELIDTAGEGVVTSELDRSAMDRARAERESADLRLLVVDGSRDVSARIRELRDSLTLTVRNKADLPLAEGWPRELEPHIELSCIDPSQAGTVRTAVGAALRAMRALPVAGPVGGPAALAARQLGML